MLVLTRKPGQFVTVFHPDGTELGRVYLEEIKPGQVLLGFEFPRNYGIVRSDIKQLLPQSQAGIYRATN